MGIAGLSLRARIALAAVAAVALGGLIAGAVLLREVEADGREAVDAQLVQRADRLMQAPGRGIGGPRGGFDARPPAEGVPPAGPALLAGSGTFVQVASGDEVVSRGGDVPDDAPGVPRDEGLTTVTVDGRPWRSLTIAVGRSDTRLQILTSLAPVTDRVASIRRLIVGIGLLALLLTGAAAWGFTALAVRPLGRLRARAERVTGTEDLAQPLPDDDGPEEVRSLAHALNEMLGRVERAVGATRRFAADAGHELRTPLTGLRANVETLQRNAALPAEQRDAAIAEMSAELERIVHLLDGLQALARGDAAASLPREPVEVADLVEAAVFAARRRHPRTSFFVAEGAEAVVDGWPEGLRLVVDNLLDNAALHGGGTVNVALTAGGDEIALRIDDDGAGIAPDERERLLAPFARGEAAAAPGTGLGLAIVAQQAALHGGALQLGASPLGGLCAEVALPATAGNLVTV